MNKRKFKLLKYTFWVIFFIIGPILIAIGSTMSHPEFLASGAIIMAISLTAEIIIDIESRKNHDEHNYDKPNKALSIYRKCVEKGYYQIDCEASIDALKIIAETYGITDFEKAKKAFEKGKAIDNKMLNIQLEAELESHQKEDEINHNKQYQLAKSIGKHKYAGNDKNKLELIKDKLIDTGKQEEKFNKLSFTDFSYTLTKGKNIEFTCNGWCVKNLTLLDSPAALDGSIKISVLDEDKKEVGYGYYSAKGNGNIDLNNVGFDEAFKVRATCLIERKVEENAGKILEVEPYTFKISPHHLWYIEK